MFGDEIADQAQYVFNITKLEPGDILLSRIPMNLQDDNTWDSHLIQTLSRSCFSFAALHVGNGLFIEGVGSGIARLPLWSAGLKDPRNVRVLRVRKGDEWVARRAAACGLRYLQRGFCQAGLPRPKCTAFQNVRRAAVVNSGLVASAYFEADFALLDNKSPYEMFPGDFLQSIFLEDVTETVLQRLSVPLRITFHLDGESLFNRVHHWEVATQLKALCNYDVRRILDFQTPKPSSMRELEQVIADKRWGVLDNAVCGSLQWYRYAAVYETRQQQLFKQQQALSTKEAPPTIPRLIAATFDENRLAAELAAIGDELALLELEYAHWQQQLDYYRELLQRYEGKVFAYMYEVFDKQINIGEQLLQCTRQKKHIFENEAVHRGIRLKIA